MLQQLPVWHFFQTICHFDVDVNGEILCNCNLNATLMNAYRGWSAVLANIVNTNYS